MKLPEIVPETFTPHWNLSLSNEEYHADKSAVSSTSLKQILKSPRAFLAAHSGELLNHDSQALRFGSAVHMALLEPEKFQKSFVIQPKFSGLGSVKMREDWKLSLPKDAVILKEDEYADLQGMVESVLKHKDAYNILRNGKFEMSGYFRDPLTGIKCRIRPDFWHEGHAALLDVKTTRSVEEKEFSKSIWSYRYDFQAAMYCLGIEQITGKKVEYPLYLAIEKTKPYECSVYLADSVLLAKGESDYHLAMEKLKQCIQSNSWPAYQSTIQPISLPRWAVME